jgi:hypothetical protein
MPMMNTHSNPTASAPIAKASLNRSGDGSVGNDFVAILKIEGKTLATNFAS